MSYLIIFVESIKYRKCNVVEFLELRNIAI